MAAVVTDRDDAAPPGEAGGQSARLTEALRDFAEAISHSPVGEVEPATAHRYMRVVRTPRPARQTGSGSREPNSRTTGVVHHIRGGSRVCALRRTDDRRTRSLETKTLSRSVAVVHASCGWPPSKLVRLGEPGILHAAILPRTATSDDGAWGLMQIFRRGQR